MKTLKDLFLHQLADICDAEKRFARALPQMELAAAGERLKRIFRKHRGETDDHLEKLDLVFGHFGAKAAARSCAATVGLVGEAEEIAAAFKGSPALDAALICVAQKFEHYEIASYGCLREWAELLGNTPAMDVLQGILEEEKTANEALTQLARARSNEGGCPAAAEDDTCGNADGAKTATAR